MSTYIALQQLSSALEGVASSSSSAEARTINAHKLFWHAAAPIGETLVLRADKPAAVDFAGGSLPASAFLARVAVRLFEGEREIVPRPALSVGGQEVAAPRC